MSFDSISLIPRVVSTIDSRDDIEIKVKFNKNVTLTAPIITAPMKDVCDKVIAKEINRLGGLGIIHRFMSIEEQVDSYKESEAACAIGVNEDFLERFDKLYEAGCRIFCIDTANGANLRVERVINKISNYPGLSFIVGNVASKECFNWVQSLPNVVAIRVGIAGGGACTTKNATGIFHNMVSCVNECATVKKTALLVADGGIREPADLCKAIACGADLVMLGSAIASTVESPAELIKRDGKFSKVFHGSASFEIQKEYRSIPKYIEGRTKLLEFDNESLESLVSRFCDGLRSSMSYFNARNLQEFKKNVSFMHNCC